jgi:hypothetical protein
VEHVIEEHETLAHDAELLAGEIARSPESHEAEVRRLGDLLISLLPLDPMAREALARVLQVSARTAERWLEQTARFFAASVELEFEDERWSMIVERLSALSWAWSEVPSAWPHDVEDSLLDGWARELETPRMAGERTERAPASA